MYLVLSDVNSWNLYARLHIGSVLVAKKYITCMCEDVPASLTITVFLLVCKSPNERRIYLADIHSKIPLNTRHFNLPVHRQIY